MRNTIRKILLELVDSTITNNYDYIYNYKSNVIYVDSKKEISQVDLLKMGFTKYEIKRDEIKTSFDLQFYSKYDTVNNIISLEVKNNKLYYKSFGNSQNPYTSVQFKKLLLHLKQKGYTTLVYNEIELKIDDIVKDKQNVNTIKPKKLYHGTSSSKLSNISSLGLYSTSNNTNFEEVNHNGIIFLTSLKEVAIEYANISSKKNNDIPIVLEIDSGKLSMDKFIIDFDMYIRSIDNNSIQKYDNILNNIDRNKTKTSQFKNKTKELNRPTKFEKIGYMGRIPPILINYVWYGSNFNKKSTLQNFN